MSPCGLRNNAYESIMFFDRVYWMITYGALLKKHSEEALRRLTSMHGRVTATAAPAFPTSTAARFPAQNGGAARSAGRDEERRRRN
jgi:hypothetical protein